MKAKRHEHFCELSFISVGPLRATLVIGWSIMGPFTCTETMALNRYINICILWPEFSNWPPIYSLG